LLNQTADRRESTSKISCSKKKRKTTQN